MTRTASGSSRLTGAPLLAARACWLALALLTLAVVAVELPRALGELMRVCDAAPCGPRQPGIGLMLTLRAAGVSLEARAWLVAASAVVLMAAYALIGVLIFALRSDDWVAILSSLVLITFGATTTVIYPAHQLPEPVRGPAMLVEAALLSTLVVTLYVFPDGRPEPGWTRYAGVVWVAWIAASYVFPAWRLSVVQMSHAEFIYFRLAWYGSGIAAVALRYRRSATAAQRQQTKWVLLGVTGAVVMFFGLELPIVLLPELGAASPAGALYRLVRLPFTTFGLLLPPLALGVALLRYRLWDVDLLINRALVYGALTAALALVYLASVTLAQLVVRTIAGQESSLAVIASTLAAAGALSPLRSRIQRFIDRRFYRRKYDAERVLAALGAAVRDEIDIERITPALLRAVDESVQPAHLSLWLRERPRQ